MMENILPNSILWGVLFLICGFGFVRAKTHQYLVADLKAMFGTIIVSIAVVTSIRKLMASGYDKGQFLERKKLVNEAIRECDRKAVAQKKRKEFKAKTKEVKSGLAEIEEKINTIIQSDRG